MKGQIRGSASARLGQVQDGSRRMRPPKFLPAGHGGGAHARPRVHPARSVFDMRRRARTCGRDAARTSVPEAVAHHRPPQPRTGQGDDLARTPRDSGIDRAIRLSTAAAVLAVAGIAAYVSYWHAYAVIRAHGESGITARLEPATIDGLVYASSMVVLYAARHRLPVPALARWLLGLGIAATLTANMAQGWSHGPVGAVVAAWPAVSLAGSYELLVWLIRTSGTAGPGPSAEHPCEGAACRAVAGSAPAAAADSEQDSRSQRGAPGQARQPAGRAAGRPAIPPAGSVMMR